MLLASDEANKEFVNPKNPDLALKIVFYARTEPHNFNQLMNIEHQSCGEDCVHKSDPKFKGKTFPLPETHTQDWVHISIPGRTDLDLHEPVREDHKKRFPGQWAAYQNHSAEAEQVVGTKLEAWGELNVNQIEALKAAKFYTVEQIANCSDGQIQALGMSGSILRSKARGFILDARAAKPKPEDAAKDQTIAELKEQMKQMQEQFSKMASAQLPVPKRKGRPPKVKDGTNAAATGQPGAG